MPRTAILPQTVTASGLTATYEAANVDGNSFTWAARRILHVVNDDAAGITVTIPTPATVNGLAVEDQTVAVGAGTDVFIGPFGASAFRQDNSTVHVDYSAVASVTVAVLEV